MATQSMTSRTIKPVHPLVRLCGRQDIILVGIFIAMVALFSTLNPRFFSLAVAANIAQDFSPIMLMAIGQSFVIIARGIDLSVGSTLGLAGVVMALAIRAMEGAGFDPWLSISLGLLVAMAIGLAVGLANAFLINIIGIAPFIATLVLLGMGAGLSLVLTGGVQVAGAPREVLWLANERYFAILTLPIIVTLLITLIAWIYLRFSRFGRWTYAIGSNGFAARGAGINVKVHLTKIYVLSGILSALAGAFVYFRLGGSGSPLSGRGGELSAIAACVIGGIGLFGGSGKLTGTIMGALITTSILSGLILIGVQPNWQQIVVAALIALAVGAQSLSKNVRRQL